MKHGRLRIMIVVTHLLGTGHLARAATLARAFADAEHEVTLVSGGFPVPRIDVGDACLVQLPPLHSDGVNFSLLLDADGQPAGDDHLRRRSAALVETFRGVAPHVLVTELFPFGRRNLRQEFTALLEAARTCPEPPLVFSSIRDILAPPSSRKRSDWTEILVADRYDGVLVHSDADIVPLDLSWPVSEALSGKLAYTGFVAPAPAGAHPDRLGEDEILVSAGGGSVGDHLFAAALAAAHDTPAQRWRLLVGGADAGSRCAGLSDRAPPNVVIEPARPEFRQMLHHARASVSMCGYNTTLDLLQAGTPAVIVPFDAGGEVEQGLRAEALTRLPGFRGISAADLSGETLNAALSDLRNSPRREVVRANLDGAERSVRIVEHRVETRG